MATLREKRLFLLDMDGTIYLDDRLFDGVIPFLRYIRRVGGRYLFLTNNSSRGVEGYMESAASGILAGINAARYINGKDPFVMPGDTVMGALARYISDESVTDFQPMGANFGILPPLDERIRSKQERYEKISQRGLESAGKYIEGENEK